MTVLTSRLNTKLDYEADVNDEKNHNRNRVVNFSMRCMRRFTALLYSCAAKWGEYGAGRKAAVGEIETKKGDAIYLEAKR